MQSNAKECITITVFLSSITLLFLLNMSSQRSAAVETEFSVLVQPIPRTHFPFPCMPGLEDLEDLSDFEDFNDLDKKKNLLIENQFILNL